MIKPSIKNIITLALVWGTVTTATTFANAANQATAKEIANATIAPVTAQITTVASIASQTAPPLTTAPTTPAINPGPAVNAIIKTPTPAMTNRVNPYSHVTVVPLTPQQEKQYTDQKATEFFSSTEPLSADNYQVPQPWSRQDLHYGNVIVEKYTNNKIKNDKISFFLHGGAYIGSLHNLYRDWGLHQGDIAQTGTFLALQYRIAPQHRFPAALEDAITAYTGLLKDGYDPHKMVLIGDSAGGNLATALLVYLRDHNMPQPRMAVLISPWTDLKANLPAYTTNRSKDSILGDKNVFLHQEVKRPTYSKGANLQNPYLSTVYADLTGLPPLFISAGGDELLLDDTALLAAHAKAAGVSTTYRIYPGMSHDWTILFPELQQSKQHDEDEQTFITEHFNNVRSDEKTL